MGENLTGVDPGDGRTRQLPVEWILTIGVGAALAAGGLLWFAGRPGWADLVWGAATIAAAVPATVIVVRMLRRGRFGADLIAVLALIGSVVVGEYLAGALIAVMLASGQTLEAYAARRAARDLSALLAHAPRTARLRTETGSVEVVDLNKVRSGDRLLVGPGEVVAVDGEAEDPAVLDESVLTGESMLVDRAAGDLISSGVVNAGPAFGLRATATAAESTYAGIVRMAEQANADRAPMVRLADRYATAFLPLALVLAGVAWLSSGTATTGVAVLVVATPCPLLLATPIAIVSGLSRAARHGVVVRDGGALENLGRATTLLVDKTGTLTAGRPVVTEIVAAAGTDHREVLRLASAVEQLSPHVLASAIVKEATARGAMVRAATMVEEEPGHGIVGTVDGRRVLVGKLDGPAPGWAGVVLARVEQESVAVAWVVVDGAPFGAILLRDPVRADAGGDAVAGFDADRKRGAQARTAATRRGHHRQLEPPNLLLGQGEANQAAAIVGHERDGFGRDLVGRQHQIAFVLAVFVVDQDHHLAGANLLDAAGYAQNELGVQFLRAGGFGRHELLAGGYLYPARSSARAKRASSAGAGVCPATSK